MDDNSRKGIRRVLKTFGIQADEAMSAYLANHPDITELKVRLTLEGVPGSDESAEPLQVIVEDVIESK